MSGNTALSYQMMFEGTFLNAMTDAEKRGAYIVAANYAKLYCLFLDIDESQWPKAPATEKNFEQMQHDYMKYYFGLWKKIAEKARQNLTAVRKKYGKGGAEDIPK